MVDGECDAAESRSDRQVVIDPIAIIADDLTGCCDTVAPFALPHRPVTVFVTPPNSFPPAGGDPGRAIIGCCTGTRHASAAKAALAVRQVCNSLAAAKTWRLFKKVDSTLKGNLGAEIEATMACAGAPLAVVCPALPEQGRTIHDAALHLTGCQETPQHLPTLLERQTRMPVRTFRREAWASLLTAELTVPNGGSEIWIMDATDGEDLDRLARLIDRLGAAAVAVGSSGLARALRGAWLPPATSPALREAESTTVSQPAAAPLVAIVGTNNPITQSQLSQLKTSHGSVEIGPGDDGELSRHLATQAPLVFHHGWGEAGDHRLGVFLAALGDGPARTLLLSGGDLAQHVCRLTQTGRMEVCGELEAGVPWGRFVDGCLQGCQWITKAGGFGTSETLCHCHERVSPSHDPSVASSPPG